MPAGVGWAALIRRELTMVSLKLTVTPAQAGKAL